MRTVGVRELKAHLSRILREVQSGEAVLVTDRGRVVAELRRPGGSSWIDSPLRRTLAGMAAEGQLRLAEPSPDPYPPSPVTSPPGTALELLAEDRGEQ
ncbi:MAG: type II toxin-antitoxin system prevent-host-death family antitoxin [Gemmatimonadales bacterium]|nr:type II toxin-antitoxin system prevent-host-death family antitoxin [Gemmatimonadales bacterium]